MSEDRAAPEEAHVVRQGYLRRLKTMKRKYFVLKSESRENSARLEYYDSDKKFRARAPPKRVIPLKTCFNINRRLDTKHKHVIALYTKEESFCVVLESEEELRSWLNALLSLHGEDGSDELQHPTQHVWSVNVQRKGLGASKHILGPYHLCLTDKTISLVKIKSNNNILYDTYVPDLLEFSLKNIRRCGDSESFFYMEMGRLTVTGAGELWMLTDDSNIAQSMHTTILGAMSNCSKENCDKDLQPTLRDRSMSADEASKPATLLNRRQTHTGVKTGLSSSNEKRLCSGGMCVTSCIKPCVTSSASYCVDPPANKSAPNTPQPVSIKESPNNKSLVVAAESSAAGGGAGDGCAGAGAGGGLPRVSHARTRSLPLAGDVDDSRAPVDRTDHRSPVNVDSLSRARQPAPAWLTRRASTGCRLAKWSPAHAKNASVGVRNRCDSMPSRTCPRDTEAERVPSRVPSQHLEDLGEVGGADEVDSAEWTPAAHRTPRIPEEPDSSPYCEMSAPAAREGVTTRRIPMKISSTHHSRNSSLAEDASPPEGYLVMVPVQDTGYVDMHGRRAASPAASGSSVASGTPSTDLRFSEYHLDPVTSKILMEDDERPIPRAYSVGSRPAAAPLVRTPLGDSSRTRAFSVGSKSKMRPLGPALPPPQAATSSTNKTSSAPLLAPRCSADTLCDDLMELDFSNNQSSPRTRTPSVVASVARTPPPTAGFVTPTSARTPIAGFITPASYSRPAKPVQTRVDEYVDMSPSTPKGSGYVEMRPTERGLTPTSAEPTSLAQSPPSSSNAIPDGYVEMNYGKRTTPSRPILIFPNTTRPVTNSSSRTSTSDSERSTPSVTSPQIYGRNGLINNNSRMKKISERQRRNSKDAGTPIGAQTIFPFTLESPASPAKPFELEKTELEAVDVFEYESSHYADIVGNNTLSTVCEISEEVTRKSQEFNPGSGPDYVTLKTGGAAASRPIAARGKLGSQSEEDAALLSSNPMATKTMTRECENVARVEEVKPALVRAPSGPGVAARFAPIGARDSEEPPRKSSSPKPVESALNRALRMEPTPAPAPPPPPLIYASLDLEPRGGVPHAPGPPPASPAPTSRAYTQIDFARSEQLNTVDSN